MQEVEGTEVVVAVVEAGFTCKSSLPFVVPCLLVIRLASWPVVQWRYDDDYVWSIRSAVLTNHHMFAALSTSTRCSSMPTLGSPEWPDTACCQTTSIG